MSSTAEEKSTGEAKPSTAAASVAPKAAPAPASTSNKKQPAATSDQLLQSTLFRLTNGLPRKELNLMIGEANECETSLEEEIKLLEKALNNADSITPSENSTLQSIMQTPLTPMDRYWTASALLGRLRDEWMLPSIIVAMEGRDIATETPVAPKYVTQAIHTHPHYTQKHEQPHALLAAWKKIAGHKSALVFKRAVRPEEAPGYTERIIFPMDLSMVRKWIVARQITSYQELQAQVALIAHNCVKYNGRESDYGRVAREFEAACEEIIRQAVLQQQQPPALARAATTGHAPVSTGAAPVTISAPATLPTKRPASTEPTSKATKQPKLQPEAK